MIQFCTIPYLGHQFVDLVEAKHILARFAHQFFGQFCAEHDEIVDQTLRQHVATVVRLTLAFQTHLVVVIGDRTGLSVCIRERESYMDR